MRNLLFATGLVSCAVFVLGCPFMKKKDDADAAADAALVEAEAPAAVVVDAAAPPVTAKNSADVARFPAETAVTDDDMKLASIGYARTTPKTGTVVATLKPGTDVVKLSEYQNSVLVTFADPKDATSTLMGWIGKEAFAASAVVKRDGGTSDAAAPVVVDAGAAPKVDAGAPPKLTCAANSVAVVFAKDPVCRKKCVKDAECKGGAAGGCANATMAAGGVARVCVAE